MLISEQIFGLSDHLFSVLTHGSLLDGFVFSLDLCFVSGNFHVVAVNNSVMNVANWFRISFWRIGHIISSFKCFALFRACNFLP